MLCKLIFFWSLNIHRVQIPYARNYKMWLVFFYPFFTVAVAYKGQLISKCPFGFIVWTKKQRNYFWISALNLFVASWRLPGDLVCNIINKEGYWKPKKLPESPQKATKYFRTEIQKYFRWYFG